MTLGTLSLMTLLAAVFGFWWHSDRIKQQALLFIHQHCRKRGLQLLDQTLVLRSVWPSRDGDGKLGLQRRYQFEFSSTGASRYSGEITLLGLRIEKLNLDTHELPDNSLP
jgi:hypothetical protein